jgi:hypothetical protein
MRSMQKMCNSSDPVSKYRSSSPCRLWSVPGLSVTAIVSLAAPSTMIRAAWRCRGWRCGKSPVSSTDDGGARTNSLTPRT